MREIKVRIHPLGTRDDVAVLETRQLPWQTSADLRCACGLSEKCAFEKGRLVNRCRLGQIIYLVHSDSHKSRLSPSHMGCRSSLGQAHQGGHCYTDDRRDLVDAAFIPPMCLLKSLDSLEKRCMMMRSTLAKVPMYDPTFRWQTTAPELKCRKQKCL